MSTAQDPPPPSDTETPPAAEEESNRIIAFEWAVYMDATLAGFSVLIPLPIVDNLCEEFFRRRMVHTIYAHRIKQQQRQRSKLHPRLVRIVNDRMSCLGKLCYVLIFPCFLLMEIITSFFKLCMLVCTVKKSTDALNYYWQRAFLINYMIQSRHLPVLLKKSSKSDDSSIKDDLNDAEVAIAVMEHILNDVGSSPLQKLASKVVFGPCRICCSLTLYVIRLLCCCCFCCCQQKQNDATMDQTQETMSESWSGFSGYLNSLAQRYDDELTSEKERRG